MHAQSLEGAFANPPLGSAACFRAALDAMARPGSLHRVEGIAPPAPLPVAAGALLLTLCDPETPVWLSDTLETDAVRGWVAFHCGAPLVSRQEARFAFGRWEELSPSDDFKIGTPDYPDRSATLVVLCDDLGTDHRLTGPGIETEVRLTVPDRETYKRNAGRFPLGWDSFLVANDVLAAMPRTTQIKE